jgi:hypothetical protein
MNSAVWYRRLRIARMRSARLDLVFFALQLVAILSIAGAICFVLSGCGPGFSSAEEDLIREDAASDSAPDVVAAQDAGGHVLNDAAEGGSEDSSKPAQDASADAPVESAAQDAPASDGSTCTPYTVKTAYVLSQPVSLPAEFYIDNEGAVEDTPAACRCVETYDCACIVAAVKAAGEPCVGNLAGCYVDGSGIVRANCGG